ncbi:MAG: DUF4276 family protein [Bryobacterales bacterium]|nr:DUF4276 family protein [Acidobacteriota bacterium]MCB9384117.1 DUF4276 family protein [Bryobacterales bacterium]
MSRLLIHVEGHTEENFVNQLLMGYLVRREILRHLKEDPSCIATTMVDFYGLPQSGEDAWPGRSDAAGNQGAEVKCEIVIQAMHRDMVREGGRGFDQRRFVPFVTMHEYEGLLFSDCAAFSRGIGQREIEAQLFEIRSAFSSPEEINDDPSTAPSKRVSRLVRSYQKTLHGPLAAGEIGLDAIREECPSFRRWLDRLVALV